MLTSVFILALSASLSMSMPVNSYDSAKSPQYDKSSFKKTIPSASKPMYGNDDTVMNSIQVNNRRLNLSVVPSNTLQGLPMNSSDVPYSTPISQYEIKDQTILPQNKTSTKVISVSKSGISNSKLPIGKKTQGLEETKKSSNSTSKVPVEKVPKIDKSATSKILNDEMKSSSYKTGSLTLNKTPNYSESTMTSARDLNRSVPPPNLGVGKISNLSVTTKLPKNILYSNDTNGITQNTTFQTMGGAPTNLSAVTKSITVNGTKSIATNKFAPTPITIPNQVKPTPITPTTESGFFY